MPTRSEVIRARRKAVGGRRLRCKKGKSCSAACINRNKFCLVDAPTPVAGALPRAVKAIKERKNGGSSRENKAKSINTGLKRKFISLRSRAKIAAASGNYKDYSKLEKALLKYQSRVSGIGDKERVKRGEIWLKERLPTNAPKLVERLKKLMKNSLEEGDGRKYEKYLARLLALHRKLYDLGTSSSKLDPLFSGIYIKDNFIKEVKDRLSKAIESGNKREYDKAEKILFKLEPAKGNREGTAWFRAKLGDTISKLKVGMERAAEAGDRSRYDKLEGKFLRIRDKVGASAITDLMMSHTHKGETWDKYQNELAVRLRNSGLVKGESRAENISIKKVQNEITVTSRVLGNKIEIFVSPNDTTTFMVNNSFTTAGDLPRREAIAVTRELSRQYKEIFSQLDDGTVFAVTAQYGDGKGGKRERSYVNAGFSDPNEDGVMFGMVRRGKITPIDEEEYYDVTG